MTDHKTPNDREDRHDLRAVTPRLDDLRRKCRSVGSKNHEATEIEARIESILNRLQPKTEPDSQVDAEPVPYAALARELYAVERFFESNGFLSMAKEVAHVERILESFAPPDQPETAIDRAGVVDIASGTEPEDPGDGNAADVDSPPSRWAVPKPLAVIGLFFVIAVAVCVVIIVRHETAPHETVEAPLPQPTPGPKPTPARPTPVSRSIAAPATPLPGAILAVAVGKARLALADGDIDLAIDHLSQAALIDADHATVIGTASSIVDLLVNRANAAVEQGLWEIAGLTLTRAERIATRFGLDTHPIDEAKHRHAQMIHFTLIQPGETDAIRASVGKRVTIFFKDGAERASIIKGVQSDQLLLDHDTTVRGGAVYYTEKVPLGDIDYLKVWDE